MKMDLTKTVVFFALTAISIFSCKKEEYFTPKCDGSNPTYNADIKTIIDANCMGSFCHSSGKKRGDFTSYEGLETVLNNGVFVNRVLDKQDMPNGNNKTLTQEEINTIQCWTNNGFPEN